MLRIGTKAKTALTDKTKKTNKQLLTYYGSQEIT